MFYLFSELSWHSAQSTALDFYHLSTAGHEMKQITKLLSFIDYPIRNCVLAMVSALMMASCGGGTPLTVEANNQAVLDYINARHTSVEPTFIAAENLNTTVRPNVNYEPVVQSFLDDSITNARAHNAVLPIDSASVASLLRTYKEQDNTYAVAYYYRALVLQGMPAATAYPTAQYLASFVNQKYDAAIRSLP